MQRIGVSGAGGRMGQTVCRSVLAASDLELVAAVDPMRVGDAIDGSNVVIAEGPEAFVAANVDVVIDFTVLDAARNTIEWCAEHGVHVVVGTTGFAEADIDRYRELFAGSAANAVIAPNYTIGAVMMMRLAELCAPYFETAEVIELHHDRKIDAPSGTAMLTAQRIAAASSEWGADPTTKHVAQGARGGNVQGVPVHSVRMRGMYAHQEVIFGTEGQTLTIRHDSFNTDCYMPGVLLAAREVANRPGLTIGLDALLGLP